MWARVPTVWRAHSFDARSRFNRVGRTRHAGCTAEAYMTVEGRKLARTGAEGPHASPHQCCVTSPPREETTMPKESRPDLVARRAVPLTSHPDTPATGCASVKRIAHNHTATQRHHRGGQGLCESRGRPRCQMVNR